MRQSTHRASVAASLTALALAVSPNVAAAQVVKAADQAKAAQQHPQVVAQFGGAIEGPLSDYVVSIGNKTAKAAALEGKCKFTVLNSDVVNAFAVQGCYIYVTRGLLTIMNSEDELASVLGHEIGHIVAKHSYRRQRASTLSALGAIALGLATKSSSVMQQAGQVAQVFTLSYSRAQENESDTYGVQYLGANGYNLYAAPDMLGALGAQEALDAKVNKREANAVPNWARSHPVSSERVARTTAAAKAAGATPTNPAERVAPYFAAIQGMKVGDDPEQGFINGRVFAHPKLKLRFEAPEGFALTNTPQAVTLQGPNSLQGQFSGGAALSGSLDAYASAALRKILGQANAQMGSPQASTINGIPAVSLLARAQTSQGQSVDVAIMAYDIGGRGYSFILTGPAGQLNPTFPMTQSLRKLSDSEAAALRARQIEIVTVRSGDTIESLSARMAYNDYRADRFKMLNAIKDDRALRPGEKLKLVVYAPTGK